MYLFHHILSHEYPLLFPYLHYLEEDEILLLTMQHFQGMDRLDTHFRDFHKKYIVRYLELGQQIPKNSQKIKIL